MERDFTALVLDLRDRLRRVYAITHDPVALERGKRVQIDAFRRRYAQWRDTRWPGDHRYDAWVAAPINNARLLPFGLYDRWTGAFAELFDHAERQWGAFYAAVRALADRPRTERERQLGVLAGDAGAPAVGARSR